MSFLLEVVVNAKVFWVLYKTGRKWRVLEWTISLSPSLFFFPSFFKYYTFVCVCTGSCVEVRGQLPRFGSLLPLCGFHVWSSGASAWAQVFSPWPILASPRTMLSEDIKHHVKRCTCSVPVAKLKSVCLPILDDSKNDDLCAQLSGKVRGTSFTI